MGSSRCSATSRSAVRVTALRHAVSVSRFRRVAHRCSLAWQPVEPTGRTPMRARHLVCVTAVATALLAPFAARAFDDAKYPNWKGEWSRVAIPSGHYRGVQYDPHKQGG